MRYEPPSTRCHDCKKSVYDNDDANVCIQCGGRNIRKPKGITPTSKERSDFLAKIRNIIFG